MNKSNLISKFALAAALTLATAFTLSCGEHGNDGGGEPSSSSSSENSQGSVSSSSGGGRGGSSSSESSPGTPHAHEWGEWAAILPATCAAAGAETRTCADDQSHTEVRIIDQLDCSDQDTSSSSVGGAASSSSSSEIPHAHEWGEWTAILPATCAAAGAETRTCADDQSHTEVRVIAQLNCGGQGGSSSSVGGEGSSFSTGGSSSSADLICGTWATTTPATCTLEGVQTRVCFDGTIQTQAITQLLAWGEWTCTASVETRTCPGNASPAETRSYDKDTYYCSKSVLKEYGFLTDSRDSKTYKTVVIGTQTWMAENLNYNAKDSKCYNSINANCDTYGRLYDWATTMNLSSSCNSSTCSDRINIPHQGICPNGWHLPSNAEWTTLTYVGGGGSTSTAGTSLKATGGWSTSTGYIAGADNYGFSALPGGYGSSDGSFYYVGNIGNWWSATENNAYYAYGRYMYYDDEYVYWNYYDKTYHYSVRCLRD